MKYVVSLLCAAFIGFACLAADATLPEDAVAQVNELKSQMRYFKAIGFHKQSKEKRDEIIAIYEKHGMPVPDEYTKGD